LLQITETIQTDTVCITEFYTVGVRSGEEVTLLCSNFSSGPTQTIWFRVVKKLQPHCISHLFTSSGPASFCDGFQNGRFQMTSNSSSVFLKIQQVNVSDSGLYFCGYFIQTNPVMVGAAYLEVQGKTVNIVVKHVQNSILGQGSFCMNYCSNAVWHGGDQSWRCGSAEVLWRPRLL
uniref:Ig-like domain-containing protein n=1 Tax=Mastacembelus armatus TaxID=205130 RepID=A0A3Q3LBP8_9TELE